MSRLFIIGNGYDVAKRGDTKYSDFKKWIKKNYLRKKCGSEVFIDRKGNIIFKKCRNLGCTPSNVYKGFNLDSRCKKILENNDKLLKSLTAAMLFKSIEMIGDIEWNYFEDDLSKLPLNAIIDGFRKTNHEDNVQLQPSLGSSVNRETNLITSLDTWIPVLIAEWIESLGNKKLHIEKGLFDKEVIGHIRADDTFMIFNYTETIENLFGLKCPCIFYHIHGIYSDARSIVVGHNDKKYKDSSKNPLDNEEDYIDQFYVDVYKCPENVIKFNQILWDRILKADHLNIYEYGWSCSQVDEDYIEKIVELRKGKDDSLHLNDYGDKGIKKAESWIKYGFDKENIYLYKEEDDGIREETFGEADK